MSDEPKTGQAKVILWGGPADGTVIGVPEPLPERVSYLGAVYSLVGVIRAGAREYRYDPDHQPAGC